MNVYEYEKGCVFVATLPNGDLLAEYFEYTDRQFAHRLKHHFKRV